jgi:hypothetical protein
MSEKPPKSEDALPAPRSSISSVKDPVYWQALGEFIETFASTETMLFAYLSMCVAIPNSTAKALLSGIHADQIIDYIRKVWVVRPPDADLHKKMCDALVQFKTISGVRNSMVHHVSFVDGDEGRVSSNITRARTAENLREFRVSPEILKNMIVNLEKITDHILYGLNIIVEPNTPRDRLMRDLPALTASWRYKLPRDPRTSKRRQRQKVRS